MSNGPGQPDGQRFASLAAQVADLRAIVMKWNARLEQAGLDGKIDLAATLAALSGKVAGETSAATAPYWLDYSEQEYQAQLADLAGWVADVLLPNYGAAVIRPCWQAHMAAIWELSTLRAEWERIYTRKNPPLADALAWHDRWLPGVIRRLGPVLKDCTATQCTLADRRKGH